MREFLINDAVLLIITDVRSCEELIMLLNLVLYSHDTDTALGQNKKPGTQS